MGGRPNEQDEKGGIMAFFVVDETEEIGIF